MYKNLILPLVFFIFSCFTHSFGQILSDVNLDLNAGGVIYDVAYNPITKSYAVGGNFSEVNGLTVSNLFFIDSLDNITALTDNSNNLVPINGAVTSVEFYEDYVPTPFMAATPGQYRYLYIGGYFDSIGTAQQFGIARLRSFYVFGQPATYFAPYKYIPWVTQLASGSTFLDIEVVGTTLVGTGEVYFSATSTVCSNCWKGTFSASATDGSLSNPQLPFLDPVSLADNASQEKYIETDGTDFILFTHEGLAKYSPLGVLDTSWGLTAVGGGNQTNFTAEELYVHHNGFDTLIYCSNTYFYPGPPASLGYSNAIYNSSETFVQDGSTYYNSPVSDAGNTFFAGYKNEQFTAIGFGAPTTCGSGSSASIPSGGTNNPSTTSGLGRLLNYERFSVDTLALKSVSYLSYLPFPTLSSQVYGESYSRRLHVAGNKLFISAENLDSVNCQIHNQAAVFCLEPADAEPFTVFDTTICYGNIKTYTIPKSDFANGYRWKYTGSDANFRISGTSGAYEPLTDTIIANLSMSDHVNSIEISFGPATTGGVLSVEPYSICNTSTDYQFARKQSITLTEAPLPDITVMDTTRLSCYSDSAYLIASSISGNTFNWNYNGLNYSNDSVLIDATNSSFTIADSVYALATVTEPINGCSSSDSTFFVVDTLAAPLPLSALSSNPSIFNCTTDSMDLIGSLAGANIEWATTAVPDSLLPNPHTIYTATPSNFIAYATYLQNGCTSQQSFLVNSDFTQADGQVNGDPNAFLTAIFDTISCADDSLSLVAEVTSAFNGIANAEWIVGGNSIGDTLYLNTSDSLGMNSFNTNSYNLRTTHSTSGCTQDYSINIYFDLDQPLIFPDNNTYSLNCSQDSVLLDHISSGSGVTEGWIDTAGNQSYSAQYYAPVAGDYIFEVIDNVNGCSNYDTVYVTQSNELFVDLQADTLICPNDTISVTAASINNPETPSFLWSNGSTSNSIDLIGGIDSQASVIVQTPSGCIGYDTINVSITAPVDLYTSGITGCVDGILQIDSVFGGAGNYLFSLDNINWQSNSSFTGLSFGEYTVHVQDDIGCVYSFNDTIDEYDSGIQTNFLVSTYNELGDTIALVNITNFTGFDSVAWFFPFNADVIFVSDSIIELSIPDEGWHDLTLTGYTDTCYYSFTKTVYFGLNKPNFTDSTGVNGIQLVTIAPNPTNGQFNLYVEFGVAQHYSVFVTNFQGQPITGMSTSGIDSEIDQDFTFPLGSPAGPYVINIISDHDAEKKTIILN